MTNQFCLSEQAIRMLNEPCVKGRVMSVLGIIDSRTIDKHMKNNYPNGPLMNHNVLEIIRASAPELNDKDVFHKLTKTEKFEINKQKERDKRKI